MQARPIIVLRPMYLRTLLLIFTTAALLFTNPASGASVETVDGQKLDGVATITSDGKLSIKGTNADERSLTWNEVRVARFNRSTAELNPLPRGWRAEDMGKVFGSSGDNKGVFTFSVNGGEVKDKKYQPLHCAFRVVRGDPEVVARITSVRGPMPAVGGVTLRENLD